MQLSRRQAMKLGGATVASDEGETYSLALLGFHRITSSLLHELKRDHPELLENLL